LGREVFTLKIIEKVKINYAKEPEDLKKKLLYES